MSQELKLKNGLTLSFREYGNRQGKPILFFHGFPGSSLQGRLIDRSRYSQKFRVLAFDRPGFGFSDHDESRKLTDVVEVVDHLISHLKIEKVDLLGVSGGSPYALATAALLPEKVSSLNLMCPLGPLHRPLLLLKMPVKAQILLLAARFFPHATSKVLASALAGVSTEKSSEPKSLNQQAKKSVVEEFSAQLPPSDVAVMSDPVIADLLSTSLFEAFNQGHQGPLHELKLFSSSWNFDLAKIKVPTHVLHGADDKVVPASLGKFISEKIKGSEFTLIENEGHYSLPINKTDLILERLAK